MAYFSGTEFDDVINISNEPLNDGEGGHSVEALAGNDTVFGSPYDDSIYGGAHSDELYGYAGNDYLDGGEGNDILYGGTGDDIIIGGYNDQGNDILVGGPGFDTLSGGQGDDVYIYEEGDGINVVNDGLTPTGASGDGGGNDTIYFPDYLLEDISYQMSGNGTDLLLSTFDDFSDGIMDSGVIVQDFFTGDPDTMIENLQSGEGAVVSLDFLIA